MRLAGETLFCVAIKALVHLSQTAEFIIRQVIERGCLNSSVKRNLLCLGELIPASVVEPVHLRHRIGDGFLGERSDPHRLLRQ